jgi:hypothetical protein
MCLELLSVLSRLSPFVWLKAFVSTTASSERAAKITDGDVHTLFRSLPEGTRAVQLCLWMEGPPSGTCFIGSVRVCCQLAFHYSSTFWRYPLCPWCPLCSFFLPAFTASYFFFSL